MSPDEKIEFEGNKSMKKKATTTIWTQNKSDVYSSVIIITIINLFGLVALIAFGKSLGGNAQIALLGSFVLSIPYLAMYVMGMNINATNFEFIFPHRKRSFEFHQIESFRVYKKLGKEYFTIKMKNPIGIRKSFSFLIKKNEAEVTEVLNLLLKQGCKAFF